ncbi:hypothetical protein A5646_03265 [Mycobacterium sp. 1245499.0]|uniref:hypothetical protein n=1 Tax=Mycobacterium sp. 1245499.0 TaxID=1834074 RepID=UPI000801A396|nr:hypothetical protein [Mycobacterium sp. 1245499.0]OBK92610.1 hypothetical protein A5646_03265 [Mycobacterium sp. 1245499.0]
MNQRKTHALAVVAAEYLPAEWKDPVRWLSARLNSGELHGIKFGRYWRMSDADIDYMLAKYSNTNGNTAAAPEKPAVDDIEPMSIVAGISQRSQRRVKRLAS